MKTEFNIKLEAADVFRFNMYHSYHRVQTWLFTFLGIAIAVLSFTTVGQVELMYTTMYFLCGAIFALYTPINLKTSSKLAVKKGNPLSYELHYVFSKEGVRVSYAQSEEREMDTDASQSVGYKQFYKIVETKDMILLYTSRVNASILPKKQIGENLEPLKQLLREQVEPHRLNLKK